MFAVVSQQRYDKEATCCVITCGSETSSARYHKFHTTLGDKCIMLGLAVEYPHDTFLVHDLQTGQVLVRQAIIWHLTPNKDTRGRLS